MRKEEGNLIACALFTSIYVSIENLCKQFISPFHVNFFTLTFASYSTSTFPLIFILSWKLFPTHFPVCDHHNKGSHHRNESEMLNPFIYFCWNYFLTHMTHGKANKHDEEGGSKEGKIIDFFVSLFEIIFPLFMSSNMYEHATAATLALFTLFFTDFIFFINVQCSFVLITISHCVCVYLMSSIFLFTTHQNHQRGKFIKNSDKKEFFFFLNFFYYFYFIFFTLFHLLFFFIFIFESDLL